MSAERRPLPVLQAELLLLLTAALGRLPVLGAWWHGADWELLGRAVGPAGGGLDPFRWLSRSAYWQALGPLLGAAPAPWAATRLLLHGVAVVLVHRLALRAGASRAGAFAAALLVSATPLAFAPLYQAAGVQELLGASLALLGAERLLAGGARAAAAATCAGLLAVLSKECALGLPLWAAALALGGDRARRRERLAAAAVLAVAAGYAAAQTLRHVPHAPGDAHALGTAAAVPLNLMQYGWWMVSPWPVPAARFTFLAGGAGLLAWLAGAAWAHRRWRGGERAPAAALLGAALALAPALPLRTHVQPHLAYAAWAAAAVALGPILARRRAPPSPALALLLALGVAAFAWGSLEWRLSRRGADGLPADPAVCLTAVSHEALGTLRAVPAGPQKRLVILRPAALSGGAPSGGGRRPTLVREALAGDLGPSLLGPPGTTVAWATDPERLHPHAMVLLDAGTRLLYWGPAPQAFLYLALTEIGLGRAAEAAGVFERGLRRSPPTLPVQFDAGQLPVSLDEVRAGAPAFLAAVDAADLPPTERAALAGAARDLLARCGAGI